MLYLKIFDGSTHRFIFKNLINILAYLHYLNIFTNVRITRTTNYQIQYKIQNTKTDIFNNYTLKYVIL